MKAVDLKRANELSTEIANLGDAEACLKKGDGIKTSGYPHEEHIPLSPRVRKYLIKEVRAIKRAHEKELKEL
jgi:hypothetical protein